MKPDGWVRLVQAGLLPAVVTTVLLALALGVENVGVAATNGVLTGLVGWAVSSSQHAGSLGRPTPVLALVLAAAVGPAVCFVVSIWVGLGRSEAAGDWIVRGVQVGACCLLVAAVLGLLGPRTREVSVGLCLVGAVVPVLVAVPMGIVALRTDERVEAAVDDFPARGPSRPADGDEAVDLSENEMVEVVRAWPGADLTCADLARRFEDWTGRAVASVPGDRTCRLEHTSAWLGRRAALRPDGTLLVAAWSPTASWVAQ
ncbi:hypothetical protein QE370_000769 [Aeromicrobium sp. SORGH_AS981]|uniref:hypothetical protein n=1 Tax=Aeromicrobium sp. SORGH_AS_0981 TaxID=3041802 RepID=UPI0028592224|nr:hypothetical protein [Aeromicrobium sp. SORGH_AS_0981]MDR6117585.1 hypothetical protein [Aeromicrobium sp. SORGH_AS_0981]